MAKVSNREDALLNAYLNRYKNAQASTVNEGQNKTQTARAKGAALLNATDKTLPVLKDTFSDTLQNIVQGASLENSLNNDVLNRQMRLAQAKFEQANDLYEQQKKAQQYAEKQAAKEAAAAAKAAAKAARSGRRSGKGSGKSGSSTGSASGEDAGAAMDALFGENSAASTADTAKNKGGNYDPKRTNAERNASARARYDDSKQEKSDVKYRAQQKAERTAQMLKDKQAAANAGANKGKAVGKSYAEQKNAGNTFTKPSVNVQSAKGGQVNQRYAELEEEDTTRKTTEKSGQRGIGSRIADLAKGTAKQAIGAALSFLEAPAGGGSQANKAAQYEMRRLTETGQALNSDGSVSDAYQKALDQFENTKNDQDVLDEKFVPALGLVKEGNAQVQRGGEGLNGAGKAAYNIAAMGANMAPGMALGLVNPALGAGYMGLTSAGQKLSEETEKGMGSRDALLRGAASGLISTGTNAVPIGEFANITKNGSPILQGVLKEGVENAGQEAADYLLNTAADYALKDPDANFSLQDMASQVGMGAATGAAFGALGGVLNRGGTQITNAENTLQEDNNGIRLKDDNRVTVDGNDLYSTLDNTQKNYIPGLENDYAALADEYRKSIQQTRNNALTENPGNASDILDAYDTALENAPTLQKAADTSGTEAWSAQAGDTLDGNIAGRQYADIDRNRISAPVTIDGTTDTGYNVSNTGGVQNGTEIDTGRGIEGSEPSGAGAGDLDVQGAGRNADGNQRVFRQPVMDDAQRQVVESTGATWGNMQDTTADPQRFSKALDESIAANKHGLMVSPKSVEELQQPGTITFMGEDGLSGALVTSDGDIEAVFKNPASKTKRASTQLLITAVENGGNKLDCYGADLVNTYNRYGFEPVAKVEWNPDYAPDGWTYGPKDVYVMKLQDGVNADTILQRLGKREADGGFHTYTTADLDALPTMEYDDALAYRDSLMKAPSADAGGADALPMPARADASETVPGMDIVENARQTTGDTSGQNAARPLNGSESVPENAVGAESTQYDRREVLNQDYANQRAMGGKIDADEAAAAGVGQQTHTVYSRAEGKDTAKQDFDLLVQQNGDILSAGRTVADELARKSADGNFDASDVYRGYYAADQLQNMMNSYEKGSADAQLVQAQIENLNRAVSAGQSKNAQALSAGRWAQIDEYTPIRKFEQIAQRKVNDFAETRDGKQLESLASDVVEMAKSGPQDEEFTAFLKAQGVDVGDNPLNAQMDDLAMRIKRMADTKGIKATDEQAKSAAASILAGGNADDVFNAMARKTLGIENLSQEDYDYVKNAFAEMADMPDSKARYEKELDAYKRLAKYMPAKTFGDKMESIRYLSMLGNTRTHARNVLGNVSMGVVTRAKDNVSGVMQLALPKDQRTKAVGTTLTADGRKMVDLAKEYGQNKMYSVLYNDGKFNAESGLRAAQDTFTSKPGKVIQKAADINSALLEKEDNIFLTSAFGNAMASQLKARGYDSSVFTATDAKSKQALVDAAATALRDAKEATFHEDNFLSTALKNYQNDIKGHGVGGKILWAVGEGVLPFKKTPLNIAKNAMEYNIVGGTVEAAYRYAAGASKADVIDAAAKGLTGTALMGIGGILAYNGLLNGSKSGDDRADAFDEMTGKQEYSINIPGKGTYTIDWASPASVPLLMGAEIANEWQNDGLSVTKFLDAARKIGNPILETTMLQGLNDTLDSVSYADSNDKLATLLGGTLGSYAQQYVPTASGQIARTIDPMRRSTYGGGDSKTERNTNYAIRKAENKIPGLSMNNEPYIDQWGREEASLDGTDDTAGGMFLRGAYNFGSPGYYSAENITPVDEYLQELYGNTNDSHVLPEKASSQITVDGEGYYMTPEEKTEYAKTSGQTAYDLVDELRQNSMFLQLPEDQQSALVQDAYTVAKTAGGVAAVGGGVSGVNAKEYEAYRDGGAEGFSQYVLMKNATDLVRDEKRETSGNDNADLDTVETWNTLYSQFGEDAVGNFVNSTKEDSTVRNISDLAGDKAVTAYMQAYSAVAKTLDDDQTPDKFTVGYGMQKYGLSGDDFARAYLAAYYKKDKNGKYPEKGGTYADKAGAEIYQSYGADALRDWVNYRATIPDTNGNGKADKDEAVARLKEMDLTNELRRAYLAKTNKQWGKKNPF